MRSMAEARTSSPRFRLPKVKFPTRSRRAGTPPAKKSPSTKPDSGAKPEATKADTGSKTTEEAPGAGKTTATTTAKGKPPDPNLMERMEGLQGWMAEIERKQGRMTYFGAAAILIAILAAGAALYFGITSKSDSATKDDLDAVEKKVDGLEQAVTKNNQATQQTLNSTLTGLQNSIQTLQKQRAEDAANISTLQSQVASGALNKGAAAKPGTALTPGATTTTTPAPGKP
jgi:uncharacterized protein HemX